MLDRIIKVLEEEKIDTYLLSQRVTERAELYYIKRNLDVRRLVNTKTAELTLYADAEKNGKPMRGFSSVVLSPEMDEERIRKEIREAKHSASFALNPFFHLVKGSHAEKIVKENGLSKMSLTEMADAFSQAVFQADRRSDAFLNSLEVFCSKEEVTIKNSEGVDVSYERSTVDGEFVVQCKEPLDLLPTNSSSSV